MWSEWQFKVAPLGREDGGRGSHKVCLYVPPSPCETPVSC